MSMSEARNLKEALKLAVESAEALVDLTPANVYEALEAAPAALEGLSEIPGEWESLTDETREELVEYVEAEFDLDNDYAEAIAEQSFKTVMEGEKLIRIIRSAKQ